MVRDLPQLQQLADSRAGTGTLNRGARLCHKRVSEVKWLAHSVTTVSILSYSLPRQSCGIFQESGAGGDLCGHQMLEENDQDSNILTVKDHN